MRLQATVFRAHHPGWSWAPSSGEGARLHGGRFNPVGSPALYTSLSFQTAWLEAQQGFVFKPQPMLLCAYEVDCDDVVDLTDPATRDANGIAEADLACAWEAMAYRGTEPPTWSLARRLVAAGRTGVMVQSFAAGASRRDINVVFWDWHPAPPRMVRVIDDFGRLPKTDLSWR
jgi:RES domain-containing protein